MVSIVASVLTGIILTIQGAMNANIGKLSGQFAMIVGVSFVQIVFGLILLFYTQQKMEGIVSPWILISGILGIFAMYGFAFSIGNIGTLKVFALVLVGQVITSSIVDHFGLLGIEAIPFTLQRFASCLLIIAGVYLLTKSS